MALAFFNANALSIHIKNAKNANKPILQPKNKITYYIKALKY